MDGQHDAEEGRSASQDEAFYLRANCPAADENAIEAPYIVWSNDLHNLFVSFDDWCARRADDKNITVGPSGSVTGPGIYGDDTLMTEDTRSRRLGRVGDRQNAVVRDDGETHFLSTMYP